MDLIGAPLRFASAAIREIDGHKHNGSAEQRLDDALELTHQQLNEATDIGGEDNLQRVTDFEHHLREIEADLAREVPSHWLAKIGDSQRIGAAIAKLHDRVNELKQDLTLSLMIEANKKHTVQSRFLIQVSHIPVLYCVLCTECCNRARKQS